MPAIEVTAFRIGFTSKISFRIAQLFTGIKAIKTKGPICTREASVFVLVFSLFYCILYRHAGEGVIQVSK